MAFTTPTIADFKAQFNREFVYGSGFDTVQDADITRGLNEAGFVFNPALWVTDQEAQIAYLYASAFYLVLNIQAAGGLSAVVRGAGVNSHGGGTIQSKGVGNVNVTYDTPAYIKESPILSQFMRNDFGQSYLSLLTPRLVGNIATVAGNFNPGGGFAGNVPTLIITTTSLPGGTHNVAYVSQQLMSIGGVAPITWSLMTGTLPTGLSISPSGLVSGTPTVANTYTFRVRAVDRQQQATGANFTVVIA